MVGQREQPTKKTAEEITQDVRRKSHERSGSSRRLTTESGTMACRMILGHSTMNLGMKLPRGGTTQCSTDDAVLDRTGSKIHHSQSARNFAASNTKENRSITR
jgi:hypothetical protein